ncbi:MAG TPA: DUF2914 domain-containing protein [Desulfobacterales bacterium]|nr:DUF2914 domain-containing protein [Desulfobacterales bacterium]
MLKNTLFVLLSAFVLSGVCFAQANPAKEQMKETTPAVTQEQPAKEQMKETAPAVAQKQPALVLEEIHICTAVEDRQPSGVGTVFPDDLDKLYCFTKIAGAEEPTNVYHVWYFGDVEIARVQLPVKAKSWRTWSSKKLNMVLGNGHVEIVSESGDILGKAEFEIQAAEKAEKVEKTEKTGVSEEAKEAPKQQ